MDGGVTRRGGADAGDGGAGEVGQRRDGRVEREVGRVIQRHAGVVTGADGVDAPVSAKQRESMRNIRKIGLKNDADKMAMGELAAAL